MTRAIARVAAATALLALALAVGPVAAQQAARPSLAARIGPDVLAAIFPGAERLGPEEGAPPAAAVFTGGELVGYVFSTLDIVAAPGYSSVPFDVVAGVDLSGALTGAKVLSHAEPHVLNDAIRQPLLDRFLASHAGWKLRGSNPDALAPDFLIGATVTARAMRDAVLDSARMVYGSRVERKTIRTATLDIYGYKPLTPAELAAQGSTARLVVGNAEIVALFERQFGRGAMPTATLGAPDAPFLDATLALATPPMIGRNLFRQEYSRLMQRVPEGGQAIYLAADGRFDFLEDSFIGRPDTYTLVHLRVVQGDRVFRFDRAHQQRLAAGVSAFNAGDEDFGARRVAAVFFLEPKSGFDPLKPWRLELFVDGTAPGGQASVKLALDYRLPAAHILLPGQEPLPAWLEAWQDQRFELAGLAAMLVALTAILALQGPLARRRRLHRLVRNGFLGATLVWLGWIAGGQFSILHLVNYLQAPFQGLGLAFYLAEPLIVVISVYTLLSLLLLGRGVFCGWLCPFGALQELLAQAARALRLPQWNPPETLQKKLWLGKYASALAVLGLSFYSLDAAVAAAEVEPFKTAITAHFGRAWPFVVYAGALLAVGLATERGYCRFLCPLGGALALLGHFHAFDLLRRRPQCGNPCHLCERACPVKAIPRSGQIDMDECFQCLDCQVEYYDDRRCPPLAKERKAKERAAPAPKPARTPLAAQGGA